MSSTVFFDEKHLTAYFAADFNAGGSVDTAKWRVRSTPGCAPTLIAADAAAVLLALATVALAAWWVSGPTWSVAEFALQPSLFGSPLLAFLVSVGLVVTIFAARADYRERVPLRAELQAVVMASIIGLLCNGAIAFAQEQNGSRLITAAPWIVLPIFIVSLRHLARSWLQHTGRWQIRTIVVGPEGPAQRALAALRAEPWLGCNVVHLMTPSSQSAHEMDAPTPRQRMLEFNAELLVMTHERDRLFDQDIVVLHHHKRAFAGSSLGRTAKLLFDFTAALAGVIVLSPILGLIALAVKLDGGPVFFAHTRIGQGGRHFSCLKFRSMVTNSEAVLAEVLQNHPAAAEEWRETQKLRNDPRITTVGKLLRASSLDEIPQLINVLLLDMSLVGPRPIVAAEVPRYGDNIAQYYAGRPGLTGLWQVSGRSDTSYAQRVALDTQYVSNWSIWQDFIILARTIPAVIRRRGAC